MDVNHLIGDAFQADQNNSNRAAEGEYLIDAASYVSNTDSSVSPKCNSVSFFKPESRPKECRNGVAVSDRYICYIVKGTLLRVIDTVTADKTLLKGHKSFITDVVFSGVSGDSLCSVDMGRNGDGVFFWRLSRDGDALTSQLAGKFGVFACMARPHPVRPGVWAISDGAQLAVVSEQQSSDGVSGYGDFNMQKMFSEPVRGIEFCSDGVQIIVSAGEGAHSSMFIYKLPVGGDMDRLHSHKLDLEQVFHIPMANLQSASFLHSSGLAQELVVTAQLVSAAGNQVMISVWSQENFHDKPLNLRQSVNVSFPVIASLGDGGDGYHADMIVDPTQRRGFILLSHRSSSHVCVLSVRQDGACPLAIYHASFLDLGKPILCLVPAVVQGENDVGDQSPFAQRNITQHLELTCLQDLMNAQHAIQQFHLTLDSVIPAPPPPSAASAISPPKCLPREAAVNPFDTVSAEATVEPIVAEVAPPAAGIASLMNLLKGNAAPVPAPVLAPAATADAHPLQSPAADNFPYFALSKQEEEDKQVAAASEAAKEDEVVVDSIPSDTSSGFSALVSRSEAPPVLEPSGESRQKGLQIIDYLKKTSSSKSVDNGTPPAPVSSPPPRDVNPFDEVVPAPIVPTPAAKKSGKEKKKATEPLSVATNNDNASLNQSMIGQIKDVVSSECRHAVEDILKKDDWRDEMCSQISNDLKAELTTAVSDAVREGIKEQLRESVKNYLGKSFKTAFETTLVPAFQVGTAVLHSKLQGNFDQTARAVEEMTVRNSNVTTKIDDMQAEISSLRELVASMSTEIAALREDRAALGAAPVQVAEYESDPMTLLSQGRLAEAVECALEKKNVSVLLNILKSSTADSILACCNKLVVVCVIQQLAQDFSVNDPEEGIPTRLDWLKELVMAVVSGDVQRKMSIDGDLNQSGVVASVESSCTAILQGVFDCLKKAEARITPTGSIRTDLRMLCSLVKSVE